LSNINIYYIIIIFFSKKGQERPIVLRKGKCCLNVIRPFEILFVYFILI